MKIRALAGLTALMLVACAGRGTAEPGARGEVTGTVSVAGGAGLPDDAVLALRLDDVSRADAPSDLLAEVEIPAGGRTPPIPFRIAYDPDVIQAGHTYRVSARVTSEGRLVMMSTRAYDVITRGPTNGVAVEVEVLHFVAQPDALPPGEGNPVPGPTRAP
jgi:putative lipoprotein